MPHTSEHVRSPYRMAGAVALAWLGMYVHNVADLPNLTFSSSENVLPGLVWLLLFGLWWTTPSRSGPAMLLLAWGMLNLVGGFATVLPLPGLPFKPEQSLRHYMFVIIGGITAQSFISDRLVVRDDAARTAANILANTSLYRLGFTIFMLEMVAQVGVSLMFYDLLKPVNRSVARASAILGLTGCGIAVAPMLPRSVPPLGRS